jgi:GAF domain-containing protein
MVDQDNSGPLNPMDALEAVLPQVRQWAAQRHGKIGLMANIAALLFQVLNVNGSEVVWTGFYLIDEPERPLMLGPFQGPPVPPSLEWGQSVAGLAARERSVQLVHGVKSFSGYLSVVPNTRSEAAVPLVIESRVVAVLDVQSRKTDGLGVEELAVMTDVADILTETWK